MKEKMNGVDPIFVNVMKTEDEIKQEPQEYEINPTSEDISPDTDIKDERGQPLWALPLIKEEKASEEMEIEIKEENISEGEEGDPVIDKPFEELCRSTASEEMITPNDPSPEELVAEEDGEKLTLTATTTAAAEDKTWPFQCQDCYKSFHRSSRLRSHQRLHTGERPSKASMLMPADTDVTNSAPEVIVSIKEPSHLHASSTVSTSKTSDTDVSSSTAEVAVSMNVKSCSGTSNEETIRDLESDKDMKCIFCGRSRKKVHSYYRKLHVSSNNSIVSTIISNAKIANNHEIIDKVNGYVCSRRGIAYHLICRNNFVHKCKRAEPKEKSQYHQERECHCIAYKKVCEYINDTVFEQRKCILLKQLHTMYVDRLTEEYMKRFNCLPNAFFTYYLKQKLKQTFGKKIKLLTKRNKTVVAPHNIECISNSDLKKLLTCEAFQNVALFYKEKYQE